MCMATSTKSNIQGEQELARSSKARNHLDVGNTDHRKHREKVKKGWSHISHFRRRKVRQGAINSSCSD